MVVGVISLLQLLPSTPQYYSLRTWKVGRSLNYWTTDRQTEIGFLCHCFDLTCIKIEFFHFQLHFSYILTLLEETKTVNYNSSSVKELRTLRPGTIVHCLTHQKDITVGVLPSLLIGRFYDLVCFCVVWLWWAYIQSLTGNIFRKGRIWFFTFNDKMGVRISEYPTFPPTPYQPSTAISLFPSSPARFLFFDSWDTQREPLPSAVRGSIYTTIFLKLLLVN